MNSAHRWHAAAAAAAATTARAFNRIPSFYGTGGYLYIRTLTIAVWTCQTFSPVTRPQPCPGSRGTCNACSRDDGVPIQAYNPCRITRSAPRPMCRHGVEYYARGVGRRGESCPFPDCHGVLCRTVRYNNNNNDKGKKNRT